jgi:hypothetical protein
VIVSLPAGRLDVAVLADPLESGTLWISVDPS